MQHANTSLTLAAVAVALVAAAPSSADFRVSVVGSMGTMEIPPGVSEVTVAVLGNSTTTTVGVPCVSGNGDEVCGWGIDLEASGALSMLEFVPAEPGSTIWNLESQRLRANGGLGGAGQIGSVDIGILRLERSGDAVVIAGEAGRIVSAAGESVALESGIVAVPEPGFSQMLACAFLSLLGLRAWRAWSANALG